MPIIQCKVCDTGTLTRKKRYRLSGPAVVIGYIFLVPSVIGVLFGALMLFSTGAVGVAVADQQAKEIKAELARAYVPDPIIRQVIAHKDISEHSLATLKVSQRTAIKNAETSRSASQLGAGAGAAIAGGFSLFVMIFSLCSGLLGWLLTMKKRVLQCGECSSLVQAS